MKLHSNPASPFGRKVKVTAIETGLFDRLEINNVQTSAVGPDLGLVADNPLGKIPCLVLDDGSALYDSRVICEYLDTLHGGARLFPAEGPARWTALRLQALGDGIMDAAILARYETFLRPENLRWPAWVDGQLDKVVRALDRLEAEADELGKRLDIGTIALACALGYLDFRFAAMSWRSTRPRLAAWFELFAARESMLRTLPSA
ncbi:glutathione S-transferase [Benzoatithermus flavus]|uniref:Glutathione S-transferase n=1 Tax=Benzoatithermus flavus TaxID=3108223 RepID=A0ABU8XQZ1_9PROT